MQSDLSKSIRDADKGFYPLGPLITFKHTNIRKANQDLSNDGKSPPQVLSQQRSSFLQSTSSKDPFGIKNAQHHQAAKNVRISELVSHTNAELGKYSDISRGNSRLMIN
jgi:hypothetical protein